MNAKPQVAAQHSSRGRIAAAACTAGVVVALSGNLVATAQEIVPAGEEQGATSTAPAPAAPPESAPASTRPTPAAAVGETAPAPPASAAVAPAATPAAAAPVTTAPAAPAAPAAPTGPTGPGSPASSAASAASRSRRPPFTPAQATRPILSHTGIAVLRPFHRSTCPPCFRPGTVERHTGWVTDAPDTTDAVSPDGSPVAVYLALPAGPVPDLVHGAVRPGGSILDLGSGPGRMTRPLAALGHPMVAVDDSTDMLDHVGDAERVLADVYSLRLDRRFDGVLAASHLINDPAPERRAALLEVCRAHVADDGVVVVQRLERPPESGVGHVGPVEIEVEVHEQDGPHFDATVTYRLDGRAWPQPFTARAVDDDLLATEATAAGLRFDRCLDDLRAWCLLVPR
jgi:SAM-dependent methyltransferase